MEKYLQELKKEYLKIKPPEALTLWGWMRLQQRINKDSFWGMTLFWSSAYSHVGVLLLILVAMMAGVVGSAQASLPGDILYPVKKASEQAVIQLTGDKSIQIDHRADEIIDLSKKHGQDQRVLNETIKEYKKDVSEIRKRLEKSGKGEIELEKKLDDHRGKFETEIKNNSTVSKDLQKAIEDNSQKGSSRDAE